MTAEYLSAVFAGIGALISIIGAGVSWRKEYVIVKNNKINNYNIHIQNMLNQLVALCSHSLTYWLNEEKDPSKKEHVAEDILQIIKELSGDFTEIEKKYKVLYGIIIEDVNNFNEIKFTITGSPFNTSNATKDSNKAHNISEKISDLKKILKNKIINYSS